MRRPVRVLREDVARRIAAGEVIDRPAAMVRELMDNAVDSGAGRITVEIKNGGIDMVRVSDDGSGMSEDDLKNCAQPHATSKITDAEDLMHLTTLGFRGEALASIAAVSSLSISSGGFRMAMDGIRGRRIEKAAEVNGGRGTVVTSEHLFEDFPARRTFLKRPASETMMCREMFVEKSLARSDISFRLVVDGDVRLDLKAGETAPERLRNALGMRESASSIKELRAAGKESDGIHDWKFNLVIGEPSVRRNDRRAIFVYVNGRRVQEYSLMQAIEYGCQGFFPNGTHPVAALFAEVEPSLVDFNIHPAKKEVRFRDMTSLHHGISSSLRSFLMSGLKSQMEGTDFKSEAEGASVFGDSSVAEPEERTFQKPAFPDAFPHQNETAAPERHLSENALQKSAMPGRGGADMRTRFFSFDTAKRSLGEPSLFGENEAGGERNVRYIGRAMETFIIAERGNALYFIDQHAVHERILFDEMMGAERIAQTLLIPYIVETEDEEQERYVASVLPKLAEAGFIGKATVEGVFEFSTIPSSWKGDEKTLRDALLDGFEEPERILYKVFASASCRKAVMQGTRLDDATAAEFARKAFELPDPHCPHGRPVYFRLTKEQMFANVRRTETAPDQTV